MQTSLKPILSSWRHVPHTLFAAMRRTALSALSGSAGAIDSLVGCHAAGLRATVGEVDGGINRPTALAAWRGWKSGFIRCGFQFPFPPPRAQPGKPPCSLIGLMAPAEKQLEGGRADAEERTCRL